MLSPILLAIIFESNAIYSRPKTPNIQPAFPTYIQYINYIFNP